MDCSTPGLPVHHQVPELAQTHIHWVSDAIQPSHPLSSPSPPAFNVSQHQGLFQVSQFFVSGGQSIRASVSASVLPMSIQGWFPLGLFDLLAVQGTLKSILQHHSSKVINSSVLSHLYGPALTSVHDYLKNHSCDCTDLCWQSDVSDFFFFKYSV